MASPVSGESADEPRRATLATDDHSSIAPWAGELAQAPARTPESLELPPGARVDRYEILGALGTGGMGVVYRALDLRLGREIALKLAARAGTKGGSFVDEARALAALSHPNIVTVHDVGLHENDAFIVMELLRGESLRTRAREHAPSLTDVRTWIVDLLSGLDAAHAAGLVHLDLKPDNLFITSDGHLKILDFGVARLLEDARSQRTGAWMAGTLPYMAPEQLSGGAVDARSDLFAVGVVLYELLLGHHPFRRASTIETIDAIMRAAPLEPSQARGWPDPLLARAVEACLAKDPAQRPSSARALLAELEAALGSITSLPGGKVRRVEVAHGSVMVRTHGTSGRHVVVLQGLPSHVDRWSRPGEECDFLRVLGAEHVVSVIDRCGRGAADLSSEVVAPTLEDEVDHLKAVLDEIGAEDVALVALDESAALGVLAALVHPDRISSLALVAPWGLHPSRTTARLASELAERWGRDTPDPATAEAERLTTSARRARALLTEAARRRADDLLDHLHCPTLVVGHRGAKMQPNASERIAREAPNARFAWLWGAPDAPVTLRTVAAEIARFVEEVSALPRATPPRLRAWLATDAPRAQLGARMRDAVIADEARRRALAVETPTQAIATARTLSAAGARVAVHVGLDASEPIDELWGLLERAAPGTVCAGPFTASFARRFAGAEFVEPAAPTESSVHALAARPVGPVAPSSSVRSIAPFVHRGFRIEVADGSEDRLRLIGTLQIRDPGHVVMPHCQAIHESAIGTERLVLDVRLLRQVNSSALSLFIHWTGWIRALPPERRYRLVIQQDRSVIWQRTNLAALRSLAADVLEIEG